MTESRRHALILSGSGKYSDPWHPFDLTSTRIAEILAGEGFEVEVSGDVDERMAALADFATSGDVDLLVVNIGEPGATERENGLPIPSFESDATARGRAGLLASLASGRPLLVVHVSSTSLQTVPEWEDVVGGLWIRGTSMHPDHGPAHIHLYPDRHPIVAGLHDFTVLDERYTHLRTDPDLVPLATHEHEGAEYPLLWTRQYGDARVVYDALGHDARSYDAPEHRAIVARSARWLVGDLD